MSTTIQSYIAESRRSLIDCNQADHRPTSKAQIDRDEQQCLGKYKAGLAVIAEIAEENVRLCLRYYKAKNSYGSHDLVELRVENKVVIVPRYITLIDELRKVREALK